MNIELKPIAQSKVRQMGGDVCGVLVRTQDSEVMAVSEHGRCTRLDAGVMGPVDPAGMSERELFEKWMADNVDDCDDIGSETLFQCWQAARAQGGQGAEPVAWECSGEPGLYSNITRSKGEADHHRKIGRTVRPLVYGDTHSQPAQQGSVQIPKTARKLIAEVVGSDTAHDLICRLEDHLGIYEDVYEQIVEMIEPHVCRTGINPDGPLPASVVGSVELLLEYYLNRPQPEGDGWVRCEDRLPTEADDDFNGCVWARFEDGDIELMEAEEVEQTWDDDISITHWMPTGLKRPQPPKQEGDGDE